MARNEIDQAGLERILVTGGAGFIGSAVVRALIRESAAAVLNVDKLTYAADPDALAEVATDARYALEVVDIRDRESVAGILERFEPDAVIHLAAETHVDRSIRDPAPFIHSNIHGTFSMLEAVREWLPTSSRAGHFRFLHVSTDEVFGDLDLSEAPWIEQSRYDPHSPYSASKAASDHLVRAWHRTYDVPVLLSSSSNNYGPWQHPEKLIPLTIGRAVAGEEIPVYGDGSNVRDWIHVEDNAAALLAILARGRIGETYNVGGGSEKTNLEVVHAICDTLDELKPKGAADHRELIRFVADRPGHDRRCAIDSRKTRGELLWQTRHEFASGLRETISWYLANRL